MLKVDIQLFGFDKGFFEKVFEEETLPEQPVEETPSEVVDETNQQEEATAEEVQEETTEQTNTEPVIPEKIEIEGVGELSIDEIKQGYLRQSDYTQKTQELAEQRKAMQEVQEFYNFFELNPHLMEILDKAIKEGGVEINTPETVDPNEARIRELEQRLALTELKAKYSDVDENAVISKANELGVSDLEFVYKAMKADNNASTPQIDMEALKQELMKELMPSLKAKALEEAQKEISSTQSIVTGGTDAPPTVEQPVQLSPDEVKVARMMNMTPDEYYKYKQLGN